MATKDSAQLTKLKKENANTEIDGIECYKIGDAKTGKIFFTTKGIMAFFNISDKTVSNWKKQGLEKSEYSMPRMDLYGLEAVIAWKMINVDSSNNKKGTSGSPKIGANGETDYSDVPIKNLPEHEADRRTKITKMEAEEVKLLELRGSLIPTDDVDKAMADQAVMHKSQYIDDLDTLPTILENKPKQEISVILDRHYERRLNNAVDFIGKEYEISNIIFEIVGMTMSEDSEKFVKQMEKILIEHKPKEKDNE